MHEYSIVQALVERVESEARAHRARAVHRLHVRIGELSGVEVELLLTAWEVTRDDTLCRGAPLEVETGPARWACSKCSEPIPRGDILRCRSCGEPARLVAGGEIVLQRIEMEVD